MIVTIKCGRVLMSLIKCENVTLSYEKNIVMQDLSFSLEKGEYLCIVGENGSGKSTLVKALLGLIPVTEGKIEFSDGLVRKKIAYLPQQNSGMKNFPASVREVVMSGFLSEKKFFSFYTSEERRKAEDIMKKLGIYSEASRSFCELSGGQQQRVLLARALTKDMSLLLIDEPTAGLDPIVTSEFYEIIKSINSEGVAVIMITHDIPAAIRYASCILHLHNRPLFFGSTSDYLKTETGRRYSGV